MRLTKMMRKEGFQIKKLLIPSNSGLQDITPDPYLSLGIENNPAEKYLDEVLGIEIQRRRGEDIPFLCDGFTEKGIPVVGLTGDDLFDEYRLREATGLRLLDTLDWIGAPREGDPARYSRPTLCLIGVKASSELADIPENATVVVNAKYERQAEVYLGELEESLRVQFEKIWSLAGKTETDIPEMAQYAVEVVVSGDTLKYVDVPNKIPRVPELDVVKEFRQSDLSLLTSWESPVTEVRTDQQDLDALARQYAALEERIRNPTDSYSSRLLSKRNGVLKKAGEEFAELIAAYASGDKADLIEEAQQNIWALQMMLVTSGVKWDEFMQYVGDQ